MAEPPTLPPSSSPPPAPPRTPDRPYALRIGETEHAGRGVFAGEDIPEGVLIEECPVIFVPEAELPHLLETALSDYYFGWGVGGYDAAIALGYGSLFNHSTRPNAQYVKKYQARTIFFVSLRAIEEGEEITVNYNGSPEDRSPVWFEPGFKKR